MTTAGVFLRSLCLSILCSATALPAVAQQAPPDSPQAKAIVALVEKAATLVEKQGKARAFTEFRKKGSEWFTGSTYLFSYDMKATVLLNPAFPKRGDVVAGSLDRSHGLGHFPHVGGSSFGRGFGLVG